MIQVLFFAQVRELVGIDCLELSAEYPTVSALRQALSQRGERWQLALESDNLLASVNQSLVSQQHPLNDEDEVAFFPPVTGG